MDRPIKQKCVVMVTASSLILLTVILLMYQSFVTSLIKGILLHLIAISHYIFIIMNTTHLYTSRSEFCSFKPLLKVVIQILILGCFQFRNTHYSFSWKWHFFGIWKHPLQLVLAGNDTFWQKPSLKIEKDN